MFRYCLAGRKFVGVKNRIIFCHESKLVTVRQTANSNEFTTPISIMVKKKGGVIDRFINLPCLKCVPMK